MVAQVKKKAGGEDGFTLLEILMAMIILAVGGVSVISLFAAAVKLQYDSVMDQRKAMILGDVVAEAQFALDRYKPDAEGKKLLPAEIKEKEAPYYSRDFTYGVEFKTAGSFPPGEGAIAVITLSYRGRPLEPISRILQRTVFAEKDLKESVSFEADRRADASREKDK
jgi:prepilin-type N-terminal cleavage/methylation domain-containing protein